MGIMEIRNTGVLLDKVARDGHEFSHITESARDSILADAKNIEVGIHGLKADKPCVARRRLSDDGRGMTEHVMKDVYGSFAVTATDRDFEVVLDKETGDLDIKIVERKPSDRWHSRNGVGGRATLIAWNKLGVPTISINQGIARMCWMYRAIDGSQMMREWKDEGSVKQVIAPYTEDEILSPEELKVDVTFSKMLLVRSGIAATEEDAAAIIRSNVNIPNPFADIEWDGDVIPKWIVDHWDNGLAYRADGTLAHGTVKLLLGDSPTDHTAITGDPNFVNEAVWMKTNGAGNKFWLDLTPWNFTIWALKKERRDEKVQGYDLIGLGEHFLETGSITRPEVPSGRRQKGALPLRALPGKGDPTGHDPVELKTVLDLDEYGFAVVLVRKSGSTSGPEYWSSSRAGMIGIVYNNEIHGFKDGTPGTSDFQFRAMGIPTHSAMKGRVSVFWFPPKASDTQAGVYQTVQRDRLNWKGHSDLPIKQFNDKVATAIGEQAPDLVALFAASLSGLDADGVPTDFSRVKNLWKRAGELVNGGGKFLKGEKEKALIADGTGGFSGTPAGPQGSSGSDPRDPCPECGLKVHAATCSRKPAPHGGGGGGTSGTDTRLIEDGKGTTTGRRSRAKATGTTPSGTPDEKSPNPPTVIFLDVPPDEKNPHYPATYTRPTGEFLPATGMVEVNRNHAAIKRLYGVAAGAGRDEAETKALTEKWIKGQMVNFVIGTLSLHGTELTPEAGKKEISDLAANLEKSVVWFTSTAGLLMAEDSLKQFIAGNAARRRRKSAAVPAAVPAA